MRVNAFLNVGAIWMAALLPVCIQADENVPSGENMPNPPLYTVQFGFGRDLVPAAHRRALLSLVKEIRQYDRGRAMRVTGFTDNTGPRRYNERLALRRANAVKAVLVKGGIPSEIITTHAVAKDGYISTNHTAEGRAINRRAEVHWADAGGAGLKRKGNDVEKPNYPAGGPVILNRHSSPADLRVGRYSCCKRAGAFIGSIPGAIGSAAGLGVNTVLGGITNPLGGLAGTIGEIADVVDTAIDIAGTASTAVAVVDTLITLTGDPATLDTRTVTIEWDLPEERTDGEALDIYHEISGVTIFGGPDADNLRRVAEVSYVVGKPETYITSATLDVDADLRLFAATVHDIWGNESEFSNIMGMEQKTDE